MHSTITPTPARREIIAVPLHTMIEGEHVRGDAVRFQYFIPRYQDLRLPVTLMVTFTGKCNSEAVAKSRNFWAKAVGGGYVYSDGPAIILHY